jgi:hypothetical protein
MRKFNLFNTLKSKSMKGFLNYRKRWTKAIAILACISLCSTACKKFVEADSPKTSLTSVNVYTTDATAASVINDIYAVLARSTVVRGQSINSIPVGTGLSSDELVLFGGATNGIALLSGYYYYTLKPGNREFSEASVWSNLYAQLYIANIALERLTESNGLTPSVKNQLMGESRFLRGFFYFYLTNLFGDVPLALSSDYRVNSKLSRTPKAGVLDQVITDLKEAQSLLGASYVGGDARAATSERARPTKWAATALLARAYLYKGLWAEAEAQATTVINNTALFDTVKLNEAFLKNSKEAIWQLQPVNAGWNTEDGKAFILPTGGPTTNSSSGGTPVYLSDALLNAFEPTDKRKTTWVSSVTVGSGPSAVTYYYPSKYKSATLNAPVTEYEMMLRIGEQYLIRAEARARLNKLAEAKADLNVIRTRAGLSNSVTGDQTVLLNEIYHERQVELFTEWGHRWLDLKRTGKVNDVMSAFVLSKGATWNANWALYPVPAYDIYQNPNLSQNPGY